MSVFLQEGAMVMKTGQSKADSSLKLPSLKQESENVKDISGLVKMLDQALSDGGSGSEGRKREYMYPQTTAGEIGWRSKDFCNLERFGRHARGQQGIRHLLQWPREAVY